MNRLYFVLLYLSAFLIPIGVKAQASIHSSWGEASGSSGRMTYSVGQIFVQTVSVSGVASILQGVQHPFEVLTMGMDDADQTLEGIMLFPNPTAGELNLQIQGFTPDAFSYRLMNNMGQCIQEGDIKNEASVLSMESVAVGSYRIEVANNNGKRRVFQIIKRN